MSELSDSLHFWRASSAMVREAARAASVPGTIVASNSRWATFVSLEDDQHETLAELASTLTLHWRYSEDFCLLLTLRNGSRVLGTSEIGWASIPHGTASDLAGNAGLRALSEAGILQTGVAQLELLARAVTGGKAPPEEIRDAAAQLLGLPAYEWLSPTYCSELSAAELIRRYPQAEQVEI
jgi:hypothetical protein